MNSPRQIALLFIIIFAGVAAYLYFPSHFSQEAMANQLASLLSGQPKAIDSRAKSADCNYNGALPDHACTPGEVFQNATTGQICVSGYSQTVRNVPTKLRKSVFAEYGWPYPQPYGAFEVDHLIPLALGGSNDIANLFPQPAKPEPGFREKDVVENYLHEEVCAGNVSLDNAQGAIADNWLAIYSNLSPDRIAQIKSQYKNWSE
ncbi:MAG: HNH endonuclease [Patescibacteria group bacterium]|nr:HNH endonuclease [Patescibacteria group bacterium]